MIGKGTINETSFGERKAFLLNKGVATIDGVTIDFRHPSLDSKQWGFGDLFNLCQFLPGEVSENHQLNPIGLWFPWFGTYDEDQLKDYLLKSKTATKYETAHFSAPTKLRKLNKAQTKAILDASRPKYYIHPGDRISVHNVEDEKCGPSYGVGYDAIAKLVYLEIRRRDGSSEPLATPVRVVSSHRIHEIDEEGYHFLYKLIWRIVATFNVATVESLRTVATNNPNMDTLLTKLCDFYAENEWELNPKSGDPEDEGAAEELLETLSTVAMIGYFWAQFEIRQNITPLAEAGIKARNALRTANERSTARKKADAETRWKQRAREYIITLYNQNSSLPKAEIVRRLCAKLDGEIDLPANRLIGKLIEDMREKNQIGPQTSHLGKLKSK